MKTLTSFLIILLCGCGAFAQLKSNQLMLTASVNGLTDQTIIRFDSSATDGFDSQEDAYKMMNSKNSPSLYTTLNSVDYGINTLPTNFAQIALPLNLAAPIAGNYTITARQVHPFDSIISITFVDSLTGVSQDLKAQPVYNFTLSGRDTLVNRFYIVFTKAQPQPVKVISDTVTVSQSDSITTASSDTATVSTSDTTTVSIADTAQASSADTSVSASNIATDTTVIQPADSAIVSSLDTTSISIVADTAIIAAPNTTIPVIAPGTPVVPVSDTITTSTDSSVSSVGNLPRFHNLIVTTSDTTSDTASVSIPGSSSLQSVTAVLPTVDNGNDIKLYGYGDQVTIVNGNSSSIDGSIIVYNMQGQILFEQQSIHVTNNTEYKVSVNGVSNDVYIVNLATTGTTVSQRIVLGN